MALIAKELGVSRQLVNHKRKCLGFATAYRDHVQEIRRRQFAELPASLSISEIAALLHMSHSVAKECCCQFGYKRRIIQDEILALRQSQFRKLKPGLTVDQIARKVAITRGHAHRWAHELGYPLRRAFYLSVDGRPLHDVMAGRFRKLPLGLTKRQLMKRLGRSRDVVRYWCKKFGYIPAQRKR